VNREQFLERVREATLAGRAYRVAPGPALPERVGYVGGGDDLVESLASEINAVGGWATVVDDAEAARQALVELFDIYQPKSAICWRHPLLDRIGLGDFLKARGVAQLDHASLSLEAPDARRAQVVDADIGVTSVSYAVAETGTLAVAARPGQERLASLLPPVHIAIVERSQIVPDLFDLFSIISQQAPNDMPTNLALITGPSKTGDIELTLITGVHGPGKWHVIILR